MLGRRKGAEKGKEKVGNIKLFSQKNETLVQEPVFTNEEYSQY